LLVYTGKWPLLIIVYFDELYYAIFWFLVIICILMKTHLDVLG